MYMSPTLEPRIQEALTGGEPILLADLDADICSTLAGERDPTECSIGTTDPHQSASFASDMGGPYFFSNGKTITSISG